MLPDDNPQILFCVLGLPGEGGGQNDKPGVGAGLGSATSSTNRRLIIKQLESSEMFSGPFSQM